MSGRLAQEWAEFAAQVVPRDAPPIQRQEMRRAFYAGCHVMMCIAKELGEEGISEDAGALTLELLDSEIQEFYRDIKAGKA